MDEVVKSTEKVAALLDSVPMMIAGSDDPQLQALVGGAWPMFRPVVESRLPDDPAQLDVVLETLALYALRARSDDARGFLMKVEGGEIAVRMLDHVEAAAAAETNGGGETPNFDQSQSSDDVETEPMGPPLVPEDDGAQ